MDGHFSIELDISCEKKEARVLWCAAACALREAMGDKAAILWPGSIVIGEESAAEVYCVISGKSVKLSFDIQEKYNRDTLAETVEAGIRARAAGFPENSAALLQSYCGHCRTLMKFVDTNYRGMPVYGFAFAVDKYGGLMVMTQPSHSVVTVYSGRASLAADEPEQPDMPFMPRV